MTALSTCIDALKKLPRTGWLQRGVPPSEAETVAGHTMEAQAIAVLLAVKTGADWRRAAALALFHDLAECLVGDIPLFASSKMGGLKENIELDAIDELGLPTEVKELYSEWLSQESMEARIAKVAEKLATIVESRRLQERGFNKVREIEESVKSQMEELLGREEYRFLKSFAHEIMERGSY